MEKMEGLERIMAAKLKTVNPVSQIWFGNCVRCPPATGASASPRPLPALISLNGTKTGGGMDAFRFFGSSSANPMSRQINGSFKIA